MGCDNILLNECRTACGFQSTQPEWAATHYNRLTEDIEIISIHAARVGCDFDPPHLLRIGETFQSTQPEWAATSQRAQLMNEIGISIHAARVGCDIDREGIVVRNYNFNPRSPSGLRPLTVQILKNDMQFQSTQPEWAATLNLPAVKPKKNAFQSTQPEWAATIPNHMLQQFENISIHAARVGCDITLKQTDWTRIISIHAARVGCDR